MEVFKRLNQIKRAIEHDFDPYTHEEKKSEAFFPLRWDSIALAILKLPVQPWNDPGSVSGEIDTERKSKMSWNNGNQNGNGQGYGQGFGGQPQEDVYDRLNRTKPVETRDPFIGLGPHRLMVLSIEPFMHQTHGPSARATFKVLQSTVHPVGSRVVKLWNLVKPSKFPTQANDGDRFADFVRKVKGAPDNYAVGPDCRALLQDRVADQLARGSVIDAMGANTAKPDKKPWTEVSWSPVPQTPDQIRQNRAQLDAESAPAPTPQQMQSPVPQTQLAPAPAPQGGFLAQIPPQNNGGNNGGGNGW